VRVAAHLVISEQHIAQSCVSACLGPPYRSYVIKDGRLFLSLMADGGIYEFEPVQEGR